MTKQSQQQPYTKNRLLQQRQQHQDVMQRIRPRRRKQQNYLPLSSSAVLSLCYIGLMVMTILCSSGTPFIDAANADVVSFDNHDTNSVKNAVAMNDIFVDGRRIRRLGKEEDSTSHNDKSNDNDQNSPSKEEDGDVDKEGEEEIPKNDDTATTATTKDANTNSTDIVDSSNNNMNNKNRKKESWIQFIIELFVYPTILVLSMAYQLRRMYKSKTINNKSFTTTDGDDGGGEYQPVGGGTTKGPPYIMEAEMTELTSTTKNNNDTSLDAEYGEVDDDDDDDEYEA